MTKFFQIIFLILSISLFCINETRATHIIGGDMSYTCLGNGRYKFILKIYRDKSSGTVLDGTAAIGIAKCNLGGGGIQCSSLTQRDVDLVRVNLTSTRDVPPPPYDCVETPPNVEVQEGTYEFELTLPYSATESYHIIYQRCCRNNTINNIQNPLNYGATYSIEIPPIVQSQNTCQNNSPVFKSFPPIVLCADYPLNFDHSATDAEGDSLVYSFCPAIAGGGRNGGGTTCNSPAPSPACPPPFNLVPFKAPYTAANPMGGSPMITINPRTGVISGVPTTQGQFVVGICVDEYRNGIKIGSINREFQFNVTSCKLSIVASIAADSVKNSELFIINSCGKSNIEFTNHSKDSIKIKNVEWLFNINGRSSIATTWHSIFDFKTPGTYLGQVIVNKGLPCTDTAKIEVNIFPEMDADFDYDADSCVYGPVSLLDRSFSGSGVMQSWFWNINNETTSTSRSPTHIFNNPGIKRVFLRAKDKNNCVDTITKFVPYFPIPPFLLISSSHFEICQGAPLKLSNLSRPIDSTYGIKWYFGDGDTTSLYNPTHAYDSAGIFSIKLEITSPNGCKGSKIFKDYITVRSKPKALFDFSPKNLNTFQRVTQFKDQSVDAILWNWTFGNEYSTFIQNPSYTFQDTGQYPVRLVVTNNIGCKDSLTLLVDVEPIVTYFLPNAFTPNNDGKNDEFIGKGQFYGIKDFKFKIWNRWGELIFETNNPEEGWNGRRKNQGEMSENGVYVCTIEYEGPRGKKQKIEGFATLMR
ncbi:MAG: gliding motility-associated C-terminal domain-containing protein [Saprospiraceae bacterium]|nr:gliding motility-associated C-terminal domain-containing protein [Saprospiraceae bacterium]